MNKINNDKLIDRTMFEFNDKQIKELVSTPPQINPSIDDSYIKNY